VEQKKRTEGCGESSEKERRLVSQVGGPTGKKKAVREGSQKWLRGRLGFSWAGGGVSIISDGESKVR